MRHKLVMIWLILSSTGISQEIFPPQPNSVGIVEFFQKNHKLTFPIIEINGSKSLELRFDVFGQQENVLYYTIELCDYNWEPVDIDPLDYIQGYEINSLYPFGSSMNALFDYVQYRLELPNRDLEIMLPGNYFVHVYSDEDKRAKLLSRKFIVYQELSDLDVKVDNFESSLYEDKQNVKVEVKPKGISYNELVGNIKLSVLQNYNWNSAKIFESHNTDGAGKIMYNAPGQIVFYGVNEFRFFDVKSLKFISERVEYMDYKAPFYHIYLKPDNLRGQKQYFKNEDLHGRFFISNQETHDPDTLDAEYIFVHFKLDAGVPLPTDIYIEGAITDWELKDNYMTYNPDKGIYEKVLFLKQGLYNYRYTAKDYNSTQPEWDITEGNFYQTDNAYLGILYYRPLGEIYYQPIGVGEN